MSYSVKTYTNVFDGYTTEFNVYDKPGISNECVISFDNITPIQIVIPYLHAMEPWQMKRDLKKILERAEDLTYEEYPFRSISEKEETYGYGGGDEDSYKSIYVYWHPKGSRARVRVLSRAYMYDNALNVGIQTHLNYVHLVEDCISRLLRTMKY
jgi:hypothetical protein